MSIIKLLPDELINQIAAGEVVERPASVVKELIENSLDAGSKKIVVDILEGGKKLIKVTDDGRGMIPEDIEMSIQRHATSKISVEADLWKLQTMGFRGEALASIASVSRMLIASRSRGEDQNGISLFSEGGIPVKKSPLGMHSGTIIEVQDLFFNTPVRQKYLKKEATEISLISATIQSSALSNPDVGFVFTHNGKTILELPAVNELSSRICDIFGKSTFDAMLPIFYSSPEMKIDGFVGKPLLARSNAKHQYLLVNKRPVQHYLVNHAITRAFHSMLMEHKKPVFIINITIDPSLIDVNVHPRKVEIRFEDDQNLVKAIYNMVKHALENSMLIPNGFTESQRYLSEKFPTNEKREQPLETPVFSKSSGKMNFYESRTNVNPMEFTKEISKLREHSFNFDIKNEIEEIFVLSQIANSYIIAKKNEEVILIDQHAAHERVRFELLMDQFESQEKKVQSLLVPLSVELSGDDKKILESNIEVFKNLGFDIENFGGDSYVINGIPNFLAKENIDEVVKGVLDDILNEKEVKKIQGETEKILTYMSCRSAIKFGQKLDLREMQELVNQMGKAKRPFTCPHGRPTMVSLSMDELGKMFGRK